ncbi:MAG: rhodanese-like domain-containing protein [Immundisolibacteraceae bacterium]|nr:rhodanese-like domain-containing protein [Immundisolibacteraceae bacterium]
MEFVLANWQLFAGVALVAAVLLASSGVASLGGVIQATPAQIVQVINQDKAQVIDLRSNLAFAEGHLIGAVNLVDDQLEAGIKKLKLADKPVILVADIRGSTGAATKMLKIAEVSKIYQLKGGLQSWSDEQLPLVTS